MTSKALLIAILVVLSGCGGGGGNSSTSLPAPQLAAASTGVFLDSPVAGLRYSTPTESGLTNTAGEFTYRVGETVTFKLGAITLGSATALATLTPLDLVGATSVDNARQLGAFTRLTNLLLLLQSLDQDADPSNGIDLGGLDELIDTSNVDFALNSQAFMNGSYRNVVNKFGGNFVEPKRAVNHLLASLNESVTVSLITSQTRDTDGDGAADETTTFAHNELGQLTQITTETGAMTTLTYHSTGQLASITDSSAPASFSEPSVERFNHNEAGRLSSRTWERGATVFSEITYRYDSAGNVLEQRSSTNARLPFLTTGPYYTELLFPFGIQSQLGTAAGFVAVNPSSIRDELLEDITKYQYLADGTLKEIDRQGSYGTFLATLNTESNCYELGQNFGPASNPLDSLLVAPPTAANTMGINACESNRLTKTDSFGRIIEIKIGDSVTTLFNFEGELLNSQQTTTLREGDTTRVARTDFTYNSFGDLVLREEFLNGNRTKSLTRSYERRVLASIP